MTGIRNDSAVGINTIDLGPNSTIKCLGFGLDTTKLPRVTPKLRQNTDCHI